MGLLSIVVVLVIVGVVLYLLETYIPIDPTIRVIIRVVVVVAICLWLLQFVVGYLPARLR